MSEAAVTAELARQVIAELSHRGFTLATAESLTGGLVCATLTDVPGASVCLRGGVVSYATDLKASLLGVDSELLATFGPVHDEVARQMASGVSRLCGSDIGVSTTGVAGPAEQNGVAVGTVFIAVAIADSEVAQVRALSLAGDRARIRQQTVHAALEMVAETISEAIAGQIGVPERE